MTAFHSNIIKIKTAYVNSWLYKNGSNSVLVDTGKDRSGSKVLEAITNAGLQPSDIKLILLTHPHYDHCMGVPALIKATGAKLIVQKEDEPNYRAGYCRLPRGANLPLEIWVSMGRLFMPWLNNFPKIDPDIIVNGSLDLKEQGIDVRAVHTPGHTDGSLILIVEGRHAIVGDALWGVMKSSVLPPFVDNIKDMIRSWKTIIDEGVEFIYPGHGEPYTIERVKLGFEKHRGKYGI